MTKNESDSGQAEPSQLEELLIEARKLEMYGANAVYRRVISLIELYASQTATVSDRERILRNPCDPPRGPFFHRAAAEVLQENARRSIMLKPIEAASTHMAEFFMGRTQVVEFRDEDIEIDYAEVDSKATELIRGKVPLVSVNLRVADSRSEAVTALRLLASQLENEKNPTDVKQFSTHAGDLVTIASGCNVERAEVLTSRWINGGQEYQQQLRDVLRCSSRDPCCGNTSFHYEYGAPRWETVWRDGGASAPPPVNPPAYSSRPWENRLPVLVDSALGTQTSDWGWRTLGSSTDFHGGIDVSAAAGTAVQSNVRGTVVSIIRGTNQEQGVVIRGLANETYTYWHIVPNTGLRDGASVQPGTALGTMYDWGSTTHLHYAEHTPPNGDPAQRSDENSRNPFP